MVNEIKLEMGTPVNTQQIQHDNKKIIPYVSTSDGDITVSNHLGGLVNAIMPREQNIIDSEKVKMLKNQIESGYYEIDFNKLADKLI